MSALGIALAWVALATVAFLVLSASALARTRGELEADPRIPGENPWIRGEAQLGNAPSRALSHAESPLSPLLPAGPRTLWTRPRAAAPQRRLGVAPRERRGALADASW
jgi:hypothetical protein